MENLIAIVFTFVADLISTVEFNHNGDLLATGDKGGRIVIFQKDDAVSVSIHYISKAIFLYNLLAFNFFYLSLEIRLFKVCILFCLI